MMKRYLKTFFEEKNLPFVQWELVDKTGTTHVISNEVVIEAMGKAPAAEQRAISNIIRKIDFYNGDVNDYLKHLAGALINGRTGSLYESREHFLEAWEGNDGE